MTPPRRPVLKGRFPLHKMESLAPPANTNRPILKRYDLQPKSPEVLRIQREFMDQNLTGRLWRPDMKKIIPLKREPLKKHKTQAAEETLGQTFVGVFRHLVTTLMEGGDALFSWIGRSIRRMADYYKNRPGGFALMILPPPPAKTPQAKSTKLSFIPEMKVEYYRADPGGNILQLQAPKGFQGSEGTAWIQAIRSSEGKLIDYHVRGELNSKQATAVQKDFESNLDHGAQRDYHIRFPYFRDIAYQSGTGQLLTALGEYLGMLEPNLNPGKLGLRLYNSPGGYFFSVNGPQEVADPSRHLGKMTFGLEREGEVLRVHLEKSELRSDLGIAETYHTQYLRFYLKPKGKKMLQVLPEGENHGG